MMSSMEDECGYSDPLSSHHAQQAFYLQRQRDDDFYSVIRYNQPRGVFLLFLIFDVCELSEHGLAYDFYDLIYGLIKRVCGVGVRMWVKGHKSGISRRNDRSRE